MLGLQLQRALLLLLVRGAGKVALKHHLEGGEPMASSSTPKEISIKKVLKKNIAQVKVGGVWSEMFTDSGAGESIVPSHWYRKGMGKLQTTDLNQFV